MRSHDSRRVLVEMLLRAASISLLAWMLWLSRERGRTSQVTSARSADLSRALREWTAVGVAPDGIHVLLDSVPAPRERDWLAALNAAGSRVTWSGTLPALGIDVQPIAAPRGGFHVLVSAPEGAHLVISDQVGVLDSTVASGGGARFAVPMADQAIAVHSGGSSASALVPPPAPVRGVLVIGQAGWESKFVVAALEEDGWTVDVDLRVAPGVAVTQGPASPMDTSRYSAVIALDATIAPRAAQVARYVASGGGLILAGNAASVATLASVRVGTTERVETAPSASVSAPTTLRSLPIAPLTSLTTDAVILERRGNAVVSAARTLGAGRVLQLGYEDSWRWRMSGGATAGQDHRAWWTRLVASVAYSPRSDRSSGRAAPSGSGAGQERAPDPAPIAALIDALGDRAVGATVVGRPVTTHVPLSWLFAILSFCLLAEWSSRRLRGAR